MYLPIPMILCGNMKSWVFCKHFGFELYASPQTSVLLFICILIFSFIFIPYLQWTPWLAWTIWKASCRRWMPRTWIVSVRFCVAAALALAKTWTARISVSAWYAVTKRWMQHWCHAVTVCSVPIVRIVYRPVVMHCVQYAMKMLYKQSASSTPRSVCNATNTKLCSLCFPFEWNFVGANWKISNWWVLRWCTNLQGWMHRLIPSSEIETAHQENPKFIFV